MFLILNQNIEKGRGLSFYKWVQTEVICIHFIWERTADYGIKKSIAGKTHNRSFISDRRTGKGSPSEFNRYVNASHLLLLYLCLMQTFRFLSLHGTGNFGCKNKEIFVLEEMCLFPCSQQSNTKLLLFVFHVL